MQNGLLVKEVNFLDSTLVAAQDKDGSIWVGISYICNGLGLNKNEKDRQVKKVQTDATLRRGCVKFDAGVFDNNNETIALQLDFVPLWLAKISVTPNMKRNNPELANKLVEYQLRAKDVLAAAFLQKTVKQPPVPFREQLEAAAFIAADLHVNEVSKLTMYQKLCESNHVSPDFLPDYAADTGREKKPITELLKQYQIPMTAAKFNQLLIAAGILEERERSSTTGKNGKKKFKVLTEKGLEYGENLVSKYNPKQSQPYYYKDKFLELYKILTQTEVLV